MNLNEIKPIGPHVEGFIRFASEGEGETLTQHPQFEVLSRSHELLQGGMPKLKEHAATAELLKLEQNTSAGVIKVIPIRLMFNKVENNLSASYQAFDSDLGRMVCTGDGKVASRKEVTTGQPTSCECLGPDSCAYANSSGVKCHLSVRLKVQLKGQIDPLSVFEFQSSSINTYRTLSAKLQMLRSVCQEKLRNIPLELTIWEKSSQMSSYAPFYCADLKLEGGLDLLKAIAASKQAEDLETAAGLAVNAMESVADSMRANLEPLMDDDILVLTCTPREASSRRTRASTAAKAAGGLMPDIAQIVQTARDRGAAAVAQIEGQAATVTKPVQVENQTPAKIEPEVPALAVESAAAQTELPPTAL